jgi:hypothetical protein
MATLSALMPGLPKAAWNSGAYPWIFSTLEIIPSSVCPISIGFWIGPSAWSSRSAARPSQNCSLLNRRLITVGALRAPAWCPRPSEVGRPSEKPFSGAWQVAQEIVPSLLSLESK